MRRKRLIIFVERFLLCLNIRTRPEAPKGSVGDPRLSLQVLSERSDVGYGDCLQEALFIPQIKRMAFVARFARRPRQLESRFVPVLLGSEHFCGEVPHFKCSTRRTRVPPCCVTKEIRKRNGTT